MRKKRLVRSILAGFLSACFLLASVSPAMAFGEGGPEPEDGNATTAIGDTTIKTEDDGKVVITMTAKTATASWKWRTIGFYLTKNTLSVNENSLSGPAGSHGNANTTIWLDEHVCKVNGCPYKGQRDGERDDAQNSQTGQTTTKITLSKACIEAHRKAAGIELDGNEATTLYLQGVLGFYFGSTYRYGPFYSVDQAKAKNRSLGNGRDWSFYPRSSGEGWVKRYNIPIDYKPDTTEVRINYYRKNTNALKEEGYTTTWTKVASYNTEDDPAKWTSLTNVWDSIKEGNGLGFSKSNYYEGGSLHLNSMSAPRLLSQVRDGTDYDKFYVYRFSWSRITDPISSTTGVREQRHEQCYTGVIVDADGIVTQEYKEWLVEARSYAYSCVSADKGLVLNVFYKKPKKPSPQDEDESSDMSPGVKATIQSDPRGPGTELDVETYDSTAGIPSSETQYINVFAKDFLYVVGYTWRTETKSYSYHSGCTYTDPQYEDGVLISSGGWSHSYGSTTITCTWADVTSLGVWKISYADIKNKSLPHVTERIYPQGYDIPMPEIVYEGGVVSWSPYGTSNCGSHGAPNPNLTTCKSGRLVFMGQTILSDAVRIRVGDSPGEFPQQHTIGNDVLYQNGYQIPPTLANDEYRSTGKIRYTALVNRNTGYSDTLDFDINRINDVTVHTPTVSYASVPDDAKEYCQLVSPGADNAQLVLDQYFTVKDGSYGYHSDLRGYGTREYARNTSQFIAKKEVQFPFDVYSVSAHAPDTFYPADTWIELDLITGEKRFYLPVWVSEGEYTVGFRSRTINCDANIGTDEGELQSVTEATANTELENYLSSSTARVEVSGRMFGLTMYDISDYPAWGTNIFRKPLSTQPTGLKYTVGLNDRNGNAYRPDSSRKYTFALVDGAHPYLQNYGVLKPGYVERFQLTTFGDMSYGGDYIEIRPTYYYVTGSGASQVTRKVDLYYDETIDGKYEHLVKLGSERDRKNIKSMSIGNLYTSVPTEELETKASLTGESVQQIKGQTGAMYRYDRIVIPVASATFVGRNFLPPGGIPSGVDESTVARSAQRWYFEYSLPASVHAVLQGTMVDCGSRTLSVDEYAQTYGIDYKEDFWCRGGYLLVNWSIHTVSSRFSGASGGEGEDIGIGEDTRAYRLDYINAANWANGYCNMWNMEGYQYTKTDSAHKTYSFRDGDVLMFYTSGGPSGSNGTDIPGGDGNGSVRDDYRSYGTH